MDFTLLEKLSSGVENVLVMMDVFTKFTIAVPCKDLTASTVVNILVQEWFHKYVIPKGLHSYLGKPLEGKVIQALCKYFRIPKSRTIPYHP